MGNTGITHELWIAKFLEGNTYGIEKTVVQRVLGDAEEKSRRSSVIEAYITAGIRTHYLSNTSLDRSISCCSTVIRIKRTEEPQGQEKTESAETRMRVNILTFWNTVFSDSLRIYVAD